MGPATWDSRQSDNRPHSGNGLRSRNCQLNILLKYSTIKYSLIKIGELDYTSITVDEGDNMTSNQLNAIKANLARSGVTNYDVQPANGCIMVTYGRVCMYFIFRGDTIVDIQVD